MIGRPWLEALKGTMEEKVEDADVPPRESSETPLSQGCERFESPAEIKDLGDSQNKNGFPRRFAPSEHPPTKQAMWVDPDKARFFFPERYGADE